MTHLTETFWWPSGKSREETWDMMQKEYPEGRENESMIQKRLQKLKDYLLSFQNDKLIIVLVCHSEIIWWLTSYLIEGERHGLWTRNGEICNITKFILSMVTEGSTSSSQHFAKSAEVDHLP